MLNQREKILVEDWEMMLFYRQKWHLQCQHHRPGNWPVPEALEGPGQKSDRVVAFCETMILQAGLLKNRKIFPEI
jgi:hypothetical protein